MVGRGREKGGLLETGNLHTTPSVDVMSIDVISFDFTFVFVVVDWYKP